MSVAEKLLGKILSGREKKLYDKLDKKIEPHVTAAMKRTNRARFVHPLQLGEAFDDRVLPILGGGSETSLSQPFVVGVMTQLLDLQPGDRVLEIGTATGFQAMVLGDLVGPTGRVVTAEVDKKLAITASRRLKKLGATNVSVVVADGGLPFAPCDTFNKLIITASLFPSAHHPIFETLQVGGTCVVPVGGKEGHAHECDLTKLVKTNEGMKVESRKPGFQFVPMQGLLGWQSLTNGLHHARFERFFEETTKEPE